MLPQGIDFNMTEAEWAESTAAFDRNLQEFEEGNYVSTVDVTRSGMTKCNQLCSEWCWATSATMVSSTYTSISGSECNKYEAKAASMKVGKTCDYSCSRTCDQAGQPSDMIHAIHHFSGASYTDSGSSLSQQHLDQALGYGPVIFLIRWSSGGGHAITCSGVSSGKYKVHDPEGADKSLSYSQVMHYQNEGKWSATVYPSNGLQSVQV